MNTHNGTEQRSLLRRRRPHPWPIQLAVACTLAIVAALLGLWVRPVVSQFTYGFYIVAVLLATVYSGLGAGILTAILSTLFADYFMIVPVGQILTTQGEWLHALNFSIIAGFICALVYLRIRSENALRERERFIENLAATAPYTLYLYDVPSERIAYVTAGADSAHHEPQEDGPSAGRSMPPEPFALVVLPRAMLPEDRVRYSQHVSDLAALPSGTVLSFEHRIQAPHGEWRWCERQEQVYDRMEGGAVKHLLGVAQDITARKATEEQARYQAQLLDSVDQAVIAIDLDDRITYWNRFAETMYGWLAAEVLGKKITGLLAAPQSRPLAGEIMQRLRNGQSWSGEMQLQRRDGSTFFADIIDAPIYDDDGLIAGVLGVSVDSNQRKRAETYLQFLADASLELSSSLDYKTTIQRVADLTVPRLADWCSVDLLRGDGTLDLVAVAHVDPEKVRWAQALRRQYPPSLTQESGLAKVIRTGASEFYPEITDEMVDQATQDEEQLRILRKIGMRSIIIVPLRARGRIIGALTLVWSESNRRYSTPDLVFAEELANRAAVAVDNALLYQEVQIAEQQQAELLAQMESLVANAPIGIAFLDRELRYVRVNEALATFNGLPVDAHLEHRMDEVLPHLMPKVGHFIQQVLDTGEPVLNQEISGEVPLRPGEMRHCLVSWYPVTMEGGRPQYIGALVVDITERKQIEDELRASEDRFRSTFEQAAVGISHVGLDGRWLRVNSRLCEITGYRREELLQLRFQDITHPDDMAPDLQLVDDALAGKIDGYRLEKRYLRKDGALIWVHLTVSLVRDVQTYAPLYFISVVEEITQRKATETQLLLLAESSDLLSPALVDERALQSAAGLLVPRLADWCVINLRNESTGDIEPIAMAHRDPEKVQVLHALAHQYPVSSNQEAGTPAVIRTGDAYFMPRISDDDIRGDAQLALLQPVGLASLIIVPLRARSHTIGSMTLARADAWRLYTESDLRFAEELAQRIALAIDNASLYTSARMAEAQLRQLNESLEDRVAERTQELERSNRELDRFAYVASHDLKAPLRAIDNLSTWLHQDVYDLLPANSQEHLQKLRGRVRRMEKLLDDLLAYSRAGRVQHASQEVDSGALVRSIFDLLAPPPDFRLRVLEPMPVIFTQRVPLETVLRNLIGNAIKHHNRPDGYVQISAHWLSSDSDIVEFTVQDDGPGMAAEYHERIFELFQTLQPRDQVEGSGMGLAIVKKTVESVGGFISVESHEGAGACFRFTWPVRQLEGEPVVN